MKTVSEMRREMEHEAELESQIVVELVDNPVIPQTIEKHQERQKKDGPINLLEESEEMLSMMLAKEFKISYDQSWDVLGLQMRLHEYLEKIRKARAWNKGEKK